MRWSHSPSTSEVQPSSGLRSGASSTVANMPQQRRSSSAGLGLAASSGRGLWRGGKPSAPCSSRALTQEAKKRSLYANREMVMAVDYKHITNNNTTVASYRWEGLSMAEPYGK